MLVSFGAFGAQSSASVAAEIRKPTAAPVGHTAAPIAQTVASQYRQLTREVVHGYASSSQRYYSGGVWQNGESSCWYCNVGPAAGAAYLSRSEPAMLPIAVDSFNTAIADYRQADGSFGNNASPAITSAAFAVMLGLTYVHVASKLDQATRSLWQQTLGGVADYLINDHAVTWYANGNVNCSYAAALYFAWRATGQQKYLDAYNAELQYLVAPTGQLWVGFGLVLTQQPTQTDGSDGSGFLTEGSPPGWDPEYTHLQLDFLSALYSASGDPRVLRLLNLILNQELTRVNSTTFMLNALNGTRKNETMPFTSAALPLLVVDGARPDLAPLLPAAFARLSSEYVESFRYTEHNFYRGVAIWLAPVLLATEGIPAVVPPPGSSVAASSGSAVGGTHATTPAKGGSSHQQAASLVAPMTNRADQAPTVSPRVLDAKSLTQVPALEVPNLEYAYAAPRTLARGVPTATPRSARLSFAAFACTTVCTITIRPLLVIHARGEKSPVALQTFLRPSRETLRPGGLLVSRILLPSSAVEFAQRGRSVLVRLILTVRTNGSQVQGRSNMFKVVWR
jgi:hypothetical protein